MSAWSVRQIRAGLKTQTRRLNFKCEVGDRLWVREPWATAPGYDRLRPSQLPNDACIYYEAGNDYEICHIGRHRPSMFLPKRFARVWLEVLGVRRERLQDISTQDAIAEGIIKQSNGTFDGGGPAMGPTASHAFMRLWDSLNGKKAPWASDPEVIVIEFRRIERLPRHTATQHILNT